MNKDRLLKLVDFLNNLDEDKFDFEEIVGDYNNELNCGTLCCAIGWLPRVFPNLVEWSNDASDRLRCVEEEIEEGFQDVAENVFDLCPHEVSYLFVPNTNQAQRASEIPGFKLLGGEATPKEVARNIVVFIKYKESLQGL